MFTDFAQLDVVSALEILGWNENKKIFEEWIGNSNYNNIEKNKKILP